MSSVANWISRIRKLFPWNWGTAELRDQVAADVRARAVFSARVGNARFLSEVKRVVDTIAAGEMGYAEGRTTLLQTLRAIGYTPEGGFPDDPPGTVPPAVEGTLQDLMSRQRLDLIIETQVALAQGRGQQVRGTTPERLEGQPAWELFRGISADVPRFWGGPFVGTPPVRDGDVDPRSRWEIAGGKMYEGRLIALKGDPVWGELGSSGNFDDALDVDYPPFAFNSGMRWLEVSRGECRRLGVVGPNGESIDEWLSQDHPTLVGTQSGLPAARASVRGLDPAVRKAFEDSTGVVIVESTATTPGNEDVVRAELERRRLARERKLAEMERRVLERARKFEEDQRPERERRRAEERARVEEIERGDG